MSCDAIPAPKVLFACYTDRDWSRRPNHDSRNDRTWVTCCLRRRGMHFIYPILLGLLSQFDHVTVPMDGVSATVHHSFVITFIDTIVGETEILSIRMRIFIFDLVGVLRKWTRRFSCKRFFSPGTFKIWIFSSASCPSINLNTYFSGAFSSLNSGSNSCRDAISTKIGRKSKWYIISGAKHSN